MTNINCALNCIYQKEGKCSYECVAEASSYGNKDCAYFVKKEK